MLMLSKNSKSLKTLVMLLLVFGLLFTSIAVAYGHHIPALQPGDTAQTTVNLNVRSGADMSHRILSVAPKGSNGVIEARSGSWYRIQFANGREGFVFGKYLVKVSTPAPAPAPALTPAPAPKPEPISSVESTMILATTTSTNDTGLLDVLVPAFDKKYGVTTKVISVGTGEAIEMGKRGDADVILVHSRKAEDEFVASGFGINRKDVMYNFFYLVGPKNDPAKVADAKNTQAAMKSIFDADATFISRGDKSGTHNRELSMWTSAGLKPQGENWYKESGQGMGNTLMMASELGGYTLVDSGMWYAFADRVKENLKIVLKGDSALFNPYGVIAVNPEKYPRIHHRAATAFIDFITSQEGQRIIGNYERNGQRLFIPNAK